VPADPNIIAALLGADPNAIEDILRMIQRSNQPPVPQALTQPPLGLRGNDIRRPPAVQGQTGIYSPPVMR
jgi:hypothetical protein